MNEKTKCPKCGSDLTISVANQRHCNACGADFNVDRNPIATRAHKARKDAVGWPLNPARNS